MSLHRSFLRRQTFGWLLLLATTLLASCGGGGGGTASGGGTPVSGSSNEESVSSKVSAASPRVSLRDLVSVDLSGQTDLFGTDVVVSSIAESGASLAFAGAAVTLEVIKPGAGLIKLTLTGRPTDPGIALVIKVDVHPGPGQTAALFAASTDSEEDGEDGWRRLDGTFDEGTGRVNAIVDPTDFVASGGTTGPYVAYVMAAIVPQAPSQQRKSAERARTVAASAVTGTLLCPLLQATCVETSRQSRMRLRKKVGSKERPHMGMDLRATPGIGIIAAATGTVVRIRTRAQVETAKQLLDDNNIVYKKKCESSFHYDIFLPKLLADKLVADANAAEDVYQAVCGSGVTITLKVGQDYIRYFHLTDVATSYMGADGRSHPIQLGVTVPSGSTLGKTGGSGLPEAIGSGAHLHFEYRLGEEDGEHVDPFPRIVSEFGIGFTTASNLELSDKPLLRVWAVDSAGVEIRSDVGDALDVLLSTDGKKVVPGDPLRRICLTPSPASSLKLPPAKVTAWGGETCVAWTDTQGGRSNIEVLADAGEVSATYSVRADLPLAPLLLMVAADPLSFVDYGQKASKSVLRTPLRPVWLANGFSGNFSATWNDVRCANGVSGVQITVAGSHIFGIYPNVTTGCKTDVGDADLTSGYFYSRFVPPRCVMGSPALSYGTDLAVLRNDLSLSATWGFGGEDFCAYADAPGTVFEQSMNVDPFVRMSDILDQVSGMPCFVNGTDARGLIVRNGDTLLVSGYVSLPNVAGATWVAWKLDLAGWSRALRYIEQLNFGTSAAPTLSASVTGIYSGPEVSLTFGDGPVPGTSIWTLRVRNDFGIECSGTLSRRLSGW